MKIIRDNLGHICQINMDDGSEIPSGEIKTAFETITEDEKEITARVIAKEKEITERERENTLKMKEKCNFFKECTSIAAKAIIAGIDEYNRQQKIGNGNYNGFIKEGIYVSKNTAETDNILKPERMNQYETMFKNATSLLIYTHNTIKELFLEYNVRNRRFG